MSLSPLSIFNALVPKDRDTVKIARDVAYGIAKRQSLDVYAPRERAAGKLPALVFMHGGSWAFGARQEYGFAGRALAHMGYVVAVIGYRIQPEGEYPAFIEDCAAACRFVNAEAETFGGDGLGIGIVGHSAGAYNAAMVALQPQFRSGAGDIGRVWAVAGLSGPYDFLPLDSPITVRTFGEVANLPETQPIHHAHAGAPPFWLGTGGRDTLVYPRNSIALAKRLVASGATAESRIYEDMKHADTLLALSRPFRRRSTVFADLEAFLARYRPDRISGA